MKDFYLIAGELNIPFELEYDLMVDLGRLLRRAQGELRKKGTGGTP